MKRTSIFLIGVAVVLAETAIWHGPLGAGDRMAALPQTEAAG